MSIAPTKIHITISDWTDNAKISGQSVNISDCDQYNANMSRCKSLHLKNFSESSEENVSEPRIHAGEINRSKFLKQCNSFRVFLAAKMLL
jgi:hypothetical protein